MIIYLENFINNIHFIKLIIYLSNLIIIIIKIILLNIIKNKIFNNIILN
jgi:hypothetical protein